MTKFQSSFLPPLRLILVSASAFALLLASQGSADAQPGMTPPGSVAPSPPPPPPTATATGQTAPPATSPSGPPPATYPAGPPTGYPAPQPYAQPYGYQPPMQLPPQPQARVRSGFNFGLNFGIGNMESSAGEFVCNNCNETPPTVAFGFHVGTMVNPRFAILGEIWGQARSLDDNGDVTLNQTLFMIGAQYWLAERFWAKVAIGGAALSVTEYGENESIDEGNAGMLALGYELTSSPSFAWDLQFKTGAGFYENDETIATTTLSTGITWY